MEDLIGKIVCGSKSDSMMIRILRSAMNKTHEKLQFKDGPIEFLHERTTFYELAAILVEGCLKIIEDDQSEILESSSSKILSDLIEIREWLVGRIREMKQHIMEKDREFRERLENELRLREALELKERELVRLYEKIEPGLIKNEEDISKLKESFDEEVLNTKKKLEDAKMVLNTKRRARRSYSSCPNLSPCSLDKELGLVPLEDEKMIFNIEKRAGMSHSNPNLCPDSLDKERGLVVLEDEKMILNTERRARRLSASNPNLSLDSLNEEWGLVLLEDEKMILNTRRVRRPHPSNLNLSPCSLSKESGLVLLEDVEFRNIDILKKMLDLVFDRMKLVEVLPLEKQWRRGVEREVESVLVKGFVHDLQTKFDIELKKRDGFVKDSWFDFIDEMKSLFHELKDFFSRNDISNVQSFPARARRTNSEPNLDVDFTQNLTQNEVDEVCGSHHVWKIIKSHESIIHKQREQRSLLTRDVLQREGASSWIKRNEDINAMERLIQDAITRLENFTQRKHKVSDLKGVGCRNRGQEKRRIPKSHIRIDRTSTTIQSFEAEIKKLQEERDGLCFQISAIEDTYQLLFRGVMDDFSIDSCCRETDQSDSIRGTKTPQEGFCCSPFLRDYTEILLREDIYNIYFREMIEAWRSEALKQFDFEVRTHQYRVTHKEEIVRGFGLNQSDSILASKTPQEDFCCSPFLQDYTESLLREEIYKIYFKETTEAWRSEALKQFDFGVRTPQSRVMYQEEIAKRWKMNQSDPLRVSKTPQEEMCTECLLREEIYKIYFRETIEAWRLEALKQFDFELRTPQSRFTLQEEIAKQWKMSRSDSVRVSKTPQEDFRCSPILQDYIECLLREEIHKIYLKEMTKAWRYQESKQFDFEVRTPPSRRAKEGTPRSRGGDGESSLINKVDSLLKSLELEEDLMLTASSLIKEHSVSNSLVILDCEEMEERNAIEWLITDDESTFCSVSQKLERALQQLYTSKELLAELEESIEVSDGGGEYYENSQFNNILRFQEENTSSDLELEGVGETDWSENVLAIIKNFRFLVDDVEVEMHENLESKCLRLEALKRQIDALTQPVAWVRSRKLLYEKAFISRCRNLKLAENEVDLLGDQVEALLSLLEKIYLVLSRDARVLSSYFEVYDILKLIEIELNGGRSSKPKS